VEGEPACAGQISLQAGYEGHRDLKQDKAQCAIDVGSKGTSQKIAQDSSQAKQGKCKMNTIKDGMTTNWKEDI
jgi:hypothetical protein